ncbi:uncharacterized protein CCR75_009632 [Bremia lactucae]|uniref:Uncharacterized protein n=1 Tax=Bremia lactucae TaxID=4779 RepID=A0A976NYT4_BRELC|nr:hypothetical protein CCR75_009632 [Bremia lactucae]
MTGINTCRLLKLIGYCLYIHTIDLRDSVSNSTIQQTFMEVALKKNIHSEATTIHEALVFSANLRLPPSNSNEQRMNLVHETLDLL